MVLLFARRQRADAVVLGGVLVFYVVFLSSANIWGGDWGFGPRLAVPALGLFAVAAAVGVQGVAHWRSMRWLVKGMVVWGVLLTQTIHGFFPEPWAKALNPMTDIVFPMAQANVVAPNLVQKLTPIRGVMSLIPLTIVTMGVLAYCLLRGEAELSRRRRVVIVVIAVVVLGIALYALTNVPGGPTSTHAQWLKLIRLWQGREISF